MYNTYIYITVKLECQYSKGLCCNYDAQTIQERHAENYPGFWLLRVHTCTVTSANPFTMQFMEMLKHDIGTPTCMNMHKPGWFSVCLS